MWQDYSAPKELCLDSYGRDVLCKVIDEIENYLKTDVTDLEKTYFTNKIKTFETISTDTQLTVKQNLKTFLNRNESIFNNVGYFDRLWPELSTLTA